MTVKTAISKNKTLAIVELMVSFKSDKDKKVGLVDIQGNFEINPNIKDDDDKIKEFLAVNATAMVYPYARSITSILTSMDNPNAVVLPSLNFVDEFKRSNRIDEK